MYQLDRNAWAYPHLTIVFVIFIPIINVGVSFGQLLNVIKENSNFEFNYKKFFRLKD